MPYDNYPPGFSELNDYGTGVFDHDLDCRCKKCVIPDDSDMDDDSADVLDVQD